MWYVFYFFWYVYIVCHSDKTVFESAAETDKNADTDKEHIEMMTFLLAHLTAKVSLFIHIFENHPHIRTCDE